MSSWAKPGVKCVCIDDDTRGFKYSAMPKSGEIYTIRAVEYYQWPSIGGGLGVHLDEVTRSVPVPFGISRFRPLISQFDDIAMFKALLSPTPELVPTAD